MVLLSSLLIGFFACFALAYPFQESICKGKERYEQCLPIPVEDDNTITKPIVLDMIFPFAMR